MESTNYHDIKLSSLKNIEELESLRDDLLKIKNEADTHGATSDGHIIPNNRQWYERVFFNREAHQEHLLSSVLKNRVSLLETEDNLKQQGTEQSKSQASSTHMTATKIDQLLGKIEVAISKQKANIQRADQQKTDALFQSAEQFIESTDSVKSAEDRVSSALESIDIDALNLEKLNDTVSSLTDRVGRLKQAISTGRASDEDHIEYELISSFLEYNEDKLSKRYIEELQSQLRSAAEQITNDSSLQSGASAHLQKAANIVDKIPMGGEQQKQVAFLKDTLTQMQRVLSTAIYPSEKLRTLEILLKRSEGSADYEVIPVHKSFQESLATEPLFRATYDLLDQTKGFLQKMHDTILLKAQIAHHDKRLEEMLSNFQPDKLLEASHLARRLKYLTDNANAKGIKYAAEGLIKLINSLSDLYSYQEESALSVQTRLQAAKRLLGRHRELFSNSNKTMHNKLEYSVIQSQENVLKEEVKKLENLLQNEAAETHRNFLQKFTEDIHGQIQAIDMGPGALKAISNIQARLAFWSKENTSLTEKEMASLALLINLCRDLKEKMSPERTHGNISGLIGRQRQLVHLPADQLDAFKKLELQLIERTLVCTGLVQENILRFLRNELFVLPSKVSDDLLKNIQYFLELDVATNIPSQNLQPVLLALGHSDKAVRKEFEDFFKAFLILRRNFNDDAALKTVATFLSKFASAHEVNTWIQDLWPTNP